MKSKPLIFIKDIIANINNFKVPDICAQTAFYFVLSFFPFLVIFMFILTSLPIETSGLAEYVYQNVPNYLQPIVIDEFSNYYFNINFSILSISFLISIFSASSITDTFLKLLGEIYNEDYRRSFFKNRVISIVLNFILISLTFAFFVFVIILSSLINLLSNILQINLPLFTFIINFLIVPLFMFCIILCIYKASNFKKRNLHKHIVGALVATVLLIISFFVLNNYFLTFSSYLIYGMIGNFIVLLIYFYLASFIIFLGSIINKVLFFNKN